MQRVDYVYDV